MELSCVQDRDGGLGRELALRSMLVVELAVVASIVLELALVFVRELASMVAIAMAVTTTVLIPTMPVVLAEAVVRAVNSSPGGGGGSGSGC